MGGGSGYGMMGGGKEKTKTDVSRWTKGQERLAGQVISDYLMPRVGEGLPEYTGVLPGTSGPSSTQEAAFAAGAGWSPFGETKEGRPLTMDEKVDERLATRRKLLAPSQEKEDALLKEQAWKMGLGYSSDILKKRSDLEHTRTAEEEQFVNNLYDTYERLNLEVTPQAISTMMQAGELQRQVEDAGYMAEFEEWKRTQPEYSPVIDQILSILGMMPAEKGTQKTSTFYWETGAQGGYSDVAVKKDLVDLTPYAFRFKQDFINDGDRLHLGVIAQDLEEIRPDLVRLVEVDGQMVRQVNYPTLCALLLIELKAKAQGPKKGEKNG